MPKYGIHNGGHSLSEAVKFLSDILTAATSEAKGDQGIKADNLKSLQIGIQNLVFFRNVDGSFSEQPFDKAKDIG